MRVTLEKSQNRLKLEGHGHSHTQSNWVTGRWQVPIGYAPVTEQLGAGCSAAVAQMPLKIRLPPRHLLWPPKEPGLGTLLSHQAGGSILLVGAWAQSVSRALLCLNLGMLLSLPRINFLICQQDYVLLTLVRVVGIKRGCLQMSFQNC